MLLPNSMVLTNKHQPCHCCWTQNGGSTPCQLLSQVGKVTGWATCTGHGYGLPQIRVQIGIFSPTRNPYPRGGLDGWMWIFFVICSPLPPLPSANQSRFLVFFDSQLPLPSPFLLVSLNFLTSSFVACLKSSPCLLIELSQLPSQAR